MSQWDLKVFLPQIMILLIRLLQQRPLLHRMTTRTVVIGDEPIQLTQFLGFRV